MPTAVAARITALDVACTNAGGQPSGRQFIVARDFTGDGQPDYMVSEGSYGCNGRPDLFRQGGKGVVELYVGDGRGGAQRAYHQAVAMVRVQSGAPVVEVVRDVAGCGEGVARFAACGLKLTWNASTRQMVETPAGAGSAMSAATNPLSNVAALAVVESQAQFVARCAAERRRAYPSLSAAQAGGQCQDVWKMVLASKPIVDHIKALPSERPASIAATKASLTGVVWTKAQQGRLGKLDVVIEGSSAAAKVNWDWSAVGQPVPYDVAEALKVNGATLALIGCENLGAGEGTEVYRVTLPGKPAFAVTIGHRDAPTASASSTYNVVADISGNLPTLRSLNARGEEFKARCET